MKELIEDYERRLKNIAELIEDNKGLKTATLRLNTKANCYRTFISELKNLDLASIKNCAIIDYIENDAEIAMPINELMHDDGRHLTKKEYGKVLLKYLVLELRKHYS